ncbi:MAG: peptide-binding protein [Deltaproteobacteria bacterium]|nr:peptide-binding protein [Deltaproteobacteria bacterium]MCL6120444.1 peptide-binding protein [Deltaproteobacteria bacterium]
MKLSGYKKRIQYLLLIIAVLALSAASAVFFYSKSKSGVKNKRNKIVKPLKNLRNSSLIIGLPADATNLIGNMAADAPTAEVTSQIYDGLVRYNRDFKIVPDLAKSWKISNGGKTITFYLRRDVYWQNAQKFTAKDVMFTYRLMVNPKTPTPYAAEYLKVYKAQTIGKYIFRVTYKKPYAPALSSWGLSILPEKLLKGKNLLTTKLRSHPIGTGPYEFDKWVHGYEIVLKANPHYFMGAPKIKRLVYKIVPDISSMFLMLKSNGISYMGLSPIQYKYESNGKGFNSKFKKYIHPSLSFTFLGYNLLDPLFKNVKVRRALSYAINKKEIIKGALFGLGIHCYGPFMPGTYFYDKDVKKYRYNPHKALRLLRQAGWRLKKGILEKNGVPFRFTILTPQGNQERLSAAEIIQQNLKKIGIKAEIRVMEWTSLISEFIMKKKFQTVLLGFTITPDPYDNASIFTGSNIVPKGLNFTSFNNPEIDVLFRKARSTFNLKKQKKYYFKIQRILAKEAPYTFLYVPYAMPVVVRTVKGIKPAPAGIGYDIRKWYYTKFTD